MNKKVTVIIAMLFLLLLAIIPIITTLGNDTTAARPMDTNQAATATAAACQATITAYNAGYPTPTPDCSIVGAEMNNSHVEDLPVPFLTATAIAWNAKQVSLEALCKKQYSTTNKISAR